MDLQILKTTPEECKQYFENKLKFTTGPVEARHFMVEDRSISIIDVRSADDYAQGHIPRAINLPEDDWSSLRGLQKGKTNLVYCYSNVCHLAARASHLFASHGFSVMEIDGGWESWKEHNLPIERGSEDAIEKKAG